MTGIVNPIEEIAAYETLWESDKASFKKIAEIFRNSPGSKPTDLLNESQYKKNLQKVKDTISKLREVNRYRPNILINGSINYPSKLRNAKEPVELLYYTGNLDLIYSRSVAIVGTRNPTPEGVKRTEKIAKLLVQNGFTVVSGLAKGVDTAAHTSAIINGGETIAVIGTPLNQVYPKENNKLQEYIAKRHLLISQVPFIKYESQDYRSNRLFFPERNKTMSAITEATIIVEASDTSGTLIQARAALQQGRKLFILNSCFENKSISWPSYYEKRGAIRVVDFSDIVNNLNI
ncbi:DNA-processing protein DprA [Olivibacter sp. LS-1]|uniref:DNA-processing protein DprA n=1 Tax=Olivibacter sp. LS-1 TaxID=2592345 RepID=UPI0011EABFF5|nr:DNA-processing protein DprA [Olivibacter sp. LS-1]QEL01104.1 DNA-processing protein DprA [Olivibacter sp. LS-1]